MLLRTNFLPSTWRRETRSNRLMIFNRQHLFLRMFFPVLPESLSHPNMICVSFQPTQRCHHPHWSCSFALICLGKSCSDDLCYWQHRAEGNDVVDQGIVFSSWGQLPEVEKYQLSRNTVVFVSIGFWIMFFVVFRFFLKIKIERGPAFW